MDLRFLEEDTGPFGKRTMLQFRAASNLSWEDVPTVVEKTLDFGGEAVVREVKEGIGGEKKDCAQCGFKYKRRMNPEVCMGCPESNSGKTNEPLPEGLGPEPQ